MLGQAPLQLPDEITFAVLREHASALGVPFLLGSVVAGAVTAFAAAMAIDILWRFLVLRRWRQRLRAQGEHVWRQRYRDAKAAFAAAQHTPDVNPRAAPVPDRVPPPDVPGTPLPPG